MGSEGMFQTFEVTARPEQGPPRLAQLRDAMMHEGLAGWIVPRADAHQGEYVADCDARLAWLTGFTGSAGFAVVLQTKAGVFNDGRYRVQVRTQVAEVFTPVHWPEVKLSDWLVTELPDGGIIGYDPWLHTVDEIEKLEKGLAGKSIVLRACDNLIDRIWIDRPAPPAAPFSAWPEVFAGEAQTAKRHRLGAALAAEGVAAAIITLPDSIAWLLNIRGTDVPRNPVPHAFAILSADGDCDLFCRPGKADPVRAQLGEGVRVRDESEFLDAVAALSGPVKIDPANLPRIVADRLTAAVVRGTDPCLLPKACKNAVEIAGTRAAHLRDGAAMVQFLAWLDREAPGGSLTEIGVVRALETFRRATNALHDISFETISGSGPNGAVVHYRVTDETDRRISPGELLLVDSGGQYLDGTTDITRTVAVGDVPDGAAEAYTRVLKGMIGISRLRFPKGVAGGHIDVVARMALWEAGLDYDHGTGHGVGVYLSVHEGPQRISRTSDVALQPGMILSNEPGYYREGAWGIRIENLIVVREAADMAGADKRPWLDFETLTWVPFDRRLIVVDMLTPAERDWVDAYHAGVQERIGPRVDDASARWLQWACAPL
jgi:Xaa-Pro aminopeptidase